MRCTQQEQQRSLYYLLLAAGAGSTMAWGAYFFAYNRAKERYLRRAALQVRCAALGLLRWPCCGGPAPSFSTTSLQLNHIHSASVCQLSDAMWCAVARTHCRRRPARRHRSGSAPPCTSSARQRLECWCVGAAGWRGCRPAGAAVLAPECPTRCSLGSTGAVLGWHCQVGDCSPSRETDRQIGLAFVDLKRRTQRLPA